MTEKLDRNTTAGVDGIRTPDIRKVSIGHIIAINSGTKD